MNRILLLLLFLIPSVLIPSEMEITDLIKKGLDYSYNFELEKARECFRKVINENPDHPQGYHYLSGTYLWVYISNKKENDFNKFLKYSDMTIARAEKLLNTNDKDADVLYILGANYGFRAMAYMKTNSQINAVWAVKNSNKYLNETLEINSAMYDAYLGLGLFNYALSMVPGVFKWALKLAGLSGDREEGIHNLKQAYRYGDLTKTEAAYYLSQIYTETIADYNTAIGYLRQIIKQYPGNSLFKYSYAVALIKNRKPQEAEEILRKIIAERNPHFQQVTSFSYFLVGDILFRKNEFREAINYYQNFLSQSQEVDYSGIANYRMAVCYELSGDRDSAKKLYILSRNGSDDIPDDVYARRKGEIYFDRSLSSTEISLIKASNLIESGSPARAYTLLKEIVSATGSQVLKAECFYYLSDAAYEISRFDESLSFAEKVLSLNTGRENWLKPYSYFLAARALEKKGNSVRADEYLKKAGDFSDFDYQNRLTSLINSLK